MRIVDLLSENSIELGASIASKSEAIDRLVELQVKGGHIKDKDAYKAGILAREEMSSTAVGEGLLFHMPSLMQLRHPALQL